MTETKGSEPEVIVGVAWYRRKQWQRVRDISTDADDLENTYEEWLRLAEQRLEELTAAGLHVEKVDLDSEELILWFRLAQLFGGVVGPCLSVYLKTAFVGQYCALQGVRAGSCHSADGQSRQRTGIEEDDRSCLRTKVTGARTVKRW